MFLWEKKFLDCLKRHPKTNKEEAAEAIKKCMRKHDIVAFCIHSTNAFMAINYYNTQMYSVDRLLRELSPLLFPRYTTIFKGKQFVAQALSNECYKKYAGNLFNPKVLEDCDGRDFYLLKLSLSYSIVDTKLLYYTPDNPRYITPKNIVLCPYKGM